MPMFARLTTTAKSAVAEVRHGAHRRRWWLLIGGVALLAVIRALLPMMILWVVNHRLAEPGIYQGHVQRLSLALWRGAYAIEGITITADHGHGRERVLSCAHVDLHLQWHKLLRGRIVARIEIERPDLVITPTIAAAEAATKAATKAAPSLSDKTFNKPDPSQKETADRDTWQAKLRLVIPFRIDTLRIFDGKLAYRDNTKAIDLSLTRIDATVTNLVGGADPNADSVPALVEAHGVTTGDGQVTLKTEVRPWLEEPDFSLNFALVGVNLPALNPSTRSLDGLAFASGRFDGYLELAAHQGQIDGQLKTLLHDLEVAHFRGSDKKITKAFWSVVIALGESLLVNDDTGAMAARIPLRGRLDGPKTSVWTVIGTLIGNAYFTAIMPGFDGFSGANGPRISKN